MGVHDSSWIGRDVALLSVHYSSTTCSPLLPSPTSTPLHVSLLLLRTCVHAACHCCVTHQVKCLSKVWLAIRCSRSHRRRILISYALRLSSSGLG